MTIALYYPHASIRNETIIKTGLVLWDKLEFISPWKGYESHTESEKLARSLDLIWAPHLPTPQEKKLVHERVENLVTSGLPKWFWTVPTDPDGQYAMYSQKILPETWDLLLEARYAQPAEKEHPDRFIMSQQVALAVMGYLADVCAGGQKQLVTDLGESYAALLKIITNMKSGRPIGLADTSSETEVVEDEGFGKLVSVTFQAMNLEQVPIERLIDLREREYKCNDTLLRELRRNYYKRLADVTKQISREVTHEGDYLEIIRQFRQESEDDFKSLKRELRMNLEQALLTADVVSWILIPTGISIASLVNAPLGVATSALGVYKKYRDYQRERRKTLAQHPMAWLYMTRPPKIDLGKGSIY